MKQNAAGQRHQANKMTTNKTQKIARELILQIACIDETRNPFKIALEMMGALKNGEITEAQYEYFADELQRECRANGIPTENEIMKLF